MGVTMGIVKAGAWEAIHPAQYAMKTAPSKPPPGTLMTLLPYADEEDRSHPEHAALEVSSKKAKARAANYLSELDPQAHSGPESHRSSFYENLALLKHLPLHRPPLNGHVDFVAGNKSLQIKLQLDPGFVAGWSMILKTILIIVRFRNHS